MDAPMAAFCPPCVRTLESAHAQAPGALPTVRHEASHTFKPRPSRRCTYDSKDSGCRVANHGGAQSGAVRMRVGLREFVVVLCDRVR